MAAFVWRRSGIIEYLDVARAVADRFGFHIPDDAVLAIVPCWGMREQHVQKSCRRATAQFHGRVAQSGASPVSSSSHIPSVSHCARRPVRQRLQFFNGPYSARIALQHIFLLRLALVLRSSSLQSRQSVLISLANDAQRVLLLNLSHFVPVCDAAHGAVNVDDHGA